MIAVAFIVNLLLATLIIACLIAALRNRIAELASTRRELCAANRNLAVYRAHFDSELNELLRQNGGQS
jgi:hypothetical protein